MMNKILIAILFIVGMCCGDYCVAPSATGNGSGSDWNNMMAQPSTFTRGQIYWFSDGTYSSIDADDAVSGTDSIMIWHPTAENHGTETGWQDAYGDGVTLIDGGTIECGASYVSLNGQYRTDSTYGIKVKNNTTGQFLC